MVTTAKDTTDATGKAGTAIPAAAAPYVEKARAFVKAKPFAAAAAAGVIGLALLNTLRGRR